MARSLVLPTKAGTLDAFAFNHAHAESLFWLESAEAVERDGVKGAKLNLPLLLGVFSLFYLSSEGGLEFELPVSEARSFLGLSSGRKGFDLAGALEGFAGVKGVIAGEVAPLMEVSLVGDVLSVRSGYFAELVRFMREFPESGARKPFYTSVVRSGICAAKNKPAAEICIALASTIVRRGPAMGGRVSINVGTVLKACPSLAYSYLTAPPSRRARVLKRALDGVPAVFEKYVQLTRPVEVLLPRRVASLQTKIIIGGRKHDGETQS